MIALGGRSNRLLKLACVLLLLVLGIYLTLRIKGFIHIFRDHPGVLLTQAEVADEFHTAPADSRQAVVPRIVHQIFHNWTHPKEEVLPLDWMEARQSCIDFTPGWEHWLWTEKTSREFIAKNYNWFLSTYDGFGFPVQKIDTLRYFLMRHYGGIYIDLDNGCTADLEPLRFYPMWVTDGGRGTLSNNILGAEPHHPFWTMLTESIISYAWNYPLPYITISYATGQWFETDIWNQYHQKLPSGAEPLMRISMDMAEGAPPWIFFNHNRGDTWNNWDNQMFGWLGQHLFLVAGFAAALVLSVSALVTYATRLRLKMRETSARV